MSRHGIRGLLLPLLLMLRPAVAAAAWNIATLDSMGDAGRFCRIEAQAGNLQVVYLRDGGLYRLASLSGTWGAPELVTATDVAGECDIAGGKVSYRVASDGALAYAGPERASSWLVAAVDTTSDDVGRFARLHGLLGGGLAAACQNATQTSLVVFNADAGGTWSGPVTVDPGPLRGQHCDLASRPGIGLVFSQRDAGEGALLYADPRARATPGQRSTLASQDDSGRHVSLALGASGRPICSYYAIHPAGFVRIQVGEKQPDSSWWVATAVSSVGYAGDVDLGIAQASNGVFHVAFREPRFGRLYDATTAMGSFHPTAAPDLEPPASIELRAGFPNPIRESTLLRFGLPKPAPVSLCIYDAAGRRVRTLLDRVVHVAGVHDVFWDGIGPGGRRVASGVYFCQLIAGDTVRVQRLVVAR